MATVRVFSNRRCMPTGDELPFVPEMNYYRAIAQCERYANARPTHINNKVAVIPFKGDLRLVVMTERVQ